MLADLYHSPSPPGKAAGAASIGSSEAIMLAGLAMKKRWAARRKVGRGGRGGAACGWGARRAATVAARARERERERERERAARARKKTHTRTRHPPQHTQNNQKAAGLPTDKPNIVMSAAVQVIK